MPTYDYSCEDCGEFEAVRSMAERNAPCPCYYCGKSSDRVVSDAPNLSTLSGQSRAAHEINERSADSPRRLSADGPGSVDEVAVGGAKSKTYDDGSKSFPGSRPWMISR